MPQRTVQFEGKSFQFPDDATDDEISEALAGIHDQSTHAPNEGLSGTARPDNPILRDSRNPRSPVYQDSPFHESTSAENLGGWVEQGPIRAAKGLVDATKSVDNPQHSPLPGIHDAMSGSFTAATPVLPFAAAGAPVATAAGYGGSVLGGKAGRGVVKGLGGGEDAQNIGEDVGSVVGGGAGAKGTGVVSDAIPGAVRGTGRLLQKISGSPDIPDLPVPSRKAGLLIDIANAAKQGAGSIGSKMSRFGIPNAPNVYPGEATNHGPLPGEPDLPTPVRADGAEHFNDVTDRGESNRLMDDIMGRTDDRLPGRTTQDPVRPDESEHHDDVNPRYAAVDGTTTKLATVPKMTLYHGTEAKNVPSIFREGLDPSKSAYGPEDEPEGPFTFLGDHPDTAQEFTPGGGGLNERGVKGAILKAEVPENSIRSDLGEFFRAPDRIRPDQLSVYKYVGPDVHTEIGPTSDEPIPLPESPLTKPQSRSFSADDVPTPNSDTLLRAIRSAPGWPENGLPNQPWDAIHANDELPHALDTDPYNRPSNSMIQDPSYTGPERRGMPRGPGYAETSAASDPEGDGDALTQARQELPSGSLSDHLQRAAEIAAQRRQGQGQGQRTGGSTKQ